MRVGERYAIGLYVDDSGRLAGTMRVSEMLGGGAGSEKVEWKLDEWVEGEAWRNEPEIGLFVIVEKRVRRPRADERAAHAVARRGGALPRHERPPRREDRALAPRPRPRGARRRRARNPATPRRSRERAADRRQVVARGDPRRCSASARRPSSAPLGRLLKERAVDIDDQGIVHALPRKRRRRAMLEAIRFYLFAFGVLTIAGGDHGLREGEEPRLAHRRHGLRRSPARRRATRSRTRGTMGLVLGLVVSLALAARSARRSGRAARSCRTG